MVKNSPSKTLNKMQSNQSLRARASQPSFTPAARMSGPAPTLEEYAKASGEDAEFARLIADSERLLAANALQQEQHQMQHHLQLQQRLSLQQDHYKDPYSASRSVPSSSSNVDAMYTPYHSPAPAPARRNNPYAPLMEESSNVESGQSLYENFMEQAQRHQQQLDDLRAKLEEQSRATHGIAEWNPPLASTNTAKLATPTQIGGGEDYKLKGPEAYTKPFLDFMTSNPTVFHAVTHFEEQLADAGFKKLSERNAWGEDLVKGGKYFLNRNGSSLIAFTIGGAYKSGNGVAMVGAHVDALTARLKPISNKKTTAGYVQLGVAPYAGGLNSTWWDRDLGIGGRVVVKDSKTGKITTKLVKLDYPIAKIPTLAPHFGVGMLGQENKETQTVPIIGLDNSDVGATAEEFANLTLGGAGSFAATQPPKLVRAIAGELSITDYSTILNWELELFDTQPAQVGGLEKEFIFAGRIDDKVCSWAAIEGLLASTTESTKDDGIVKLVGLFDDEEIGSKLRQGAWSNFLPSVIERITETFAPSGTLSGANLLSQTYANSFLVSADVTHAVNPNFLSLYLENHAPRLNVGLCVAADSNGHMTTDSVSTALLTRCAAKSGNTLQVFMIRNDSRSGGTIGPDLSALMGVRAIDAGIPQLSMHSIRATIGNLDPGLGVRAFAGFFNEFESVDKEFAE